MPASGAARLVATIRAAMDEDSRDPADLPTSLATCAICGNDFHLRDESEPCSLCDLCAWDSLRALCDAAEESASTIAYPRSALEAERARRPVEMAAMAEAQAEIDALRARLADASIIAATPNQRTDR